VFRTSDLIIPGPAPKLLKYKLKCCLSS